ncbi:MAG: hypothetical protein ACI9W2_000960, partial [Gammaproteobacteria bacterium]
MSHRSVSAKLLNECRDLAGARLAEILPTVLDKVDDALFDLADKGENNQVQTLYFDAMREVRLRRTSIEADFRVCMARSVNQRILRDSVASGDVTSLEDSQNLILIEDDELEESLAVTNMAAKIRSACKGPLFLLDRRAAFLLDEERMDGADNPLGPEAICEAFNDACRCVEAGIEVKLLILKLFDRFAVHEMAPLYDLLNEHLAKRDVLPGLRPKIEVRRNPASSVPSAVPTPVAVPDPGGHPWGGPGGAGTPGTQGYVHGGYGSGYGSGHMQDGSMSAPVGEHYRETGVPNGSDEQARSVLVALQELMRAGVGTGFGAGPRAGTAVPPGATISGPSTALTASGAAPTFAAFVAGLTALQNLPLVLEPGAAGAQGNASGLSTTSGSVEEFADLPISQTSVRPVGFDLRSLKDGGINRLLGHDAPLETGSMDEMLIDIVAMMFDFILDDDDLPNAMKALIGRLQIPVLKVAILDRTLFSRRFHPARRLLNTLAEAAFGWDEAAGADDSLFRKIDELVHRVLDEYDDDIAVFSDVLSALQAFLDDEARERQKRIERQAAAMTNRERLDDAKLTVKQEIRTALSGIVLPPIVKLFVTRYWGGNLVVTFMRHGQQSRAWTDALATMNQLIWSVTPKASASQRAQLLEQLPVLLKRVNDGIKKVSMPAAERDQLVAALASCHAEVAKASIPAAPSPGVDAPASARNRLEDAASTKAPQGAARVPEDQVAVLTPEHLAVFVSHAEKVPAPAPSPLRARSADGRSSPLSDESNNEPDRASAPVARGAQISGDDARGGEGDPGPAGVEPPDGHPEYDLLALSIGRANRQIFDTQAADPTKAGMGTTLVVAVFRDDRVHYAHVGDSRLYRLRAGALKQLTRDHSLAQELVDKGFYTPEEAAE